MKWQSCERDGYYGNATFQTLLEVGLISFVLEQSISFLSGTRRSLGEKILPRYQIFGVTQEWSMKHITSIAKYSTN